MEKTISWESRVGLLTNPLVLKQTALTVIGAGLIMAFLLSFIMAVTGEFSSILPLLGASVLVAAGLGLLAAFIMLVFMGNRVRVRFTVSKDGILWQTVDKRVLGTNRLAVIAGVLGGSMQTAGAGALATSREKEFVAWNEIATMETNPKHLQIVLRNSWRPVMMVVCLPENFQMVVDYATQRIHPATAEDGAPRKAVVKPIGRALLRSLAVSLTSAPVFMLNSSWIELDPFFPLLMFCFALATVWLIPFFGWVVLGAGAIVAAQVLSGGIFWFSVLDGGEQAVYVLAWAGLVWLAWFSIGALRGRFPPPLLEK
ncbi:MAG TPA: hypothetical protein ENN40_09145 [Candidatus Aminicenantes bacterium]|nr:hypothetical protein [Candidatus Aminicenantes bacterium]